MGRRVWRVPAVLVAAGVGSFMTALATADPIGGGSGGMRELGYAMAFFGIMVLGAVEAVIVVLEALAYRWLLKLRFRHALLTSLCGNVASVVVGLLLRGLGARGALIALAVEVPVVLALNRGYANRRRLVASVVGVNLVIYTPLAAMLALLGAAH